MQSMPKSPPPAPKHLTKVPSRGYSGLWKFHKNIGHAKNAMTNGYHYRSEGMELYEWRPVYSVDGSSTDTVKPEYQWVLLYTWSYGEPAPWK